MLQNHPLSNAKWIGGCPECQSPVIIRPFSANSVKKATLYVTGLGYFEATINGKPVCQDRFIPLITDYEPRNLANFIYPLHDTTTHRVYYCRYDITQLLVEGENTLAIQLGNGWYRQTERDAEGETSFGTVLKTIFSIHLDTDNGKIILNSDGSETWHGSEIVYSNLFIGEVIDPTVPMGHRRKVILLSPPEAALCQQIGTPDRIIRTITPRCIGTAGNRKVYDVGENISGVVCIRTSAPLGTRITLRFAENVDEDLELNFYTVGRDYPCTSGRYQIMTDTFIADGTVRSYEPKFVWHAFRYFDVTGDIDEAQVLVIHSDTPVTAEFSSPSEGLNYLFETFLRTQTNNMHGSIPSDCPHRERLGYTGDGQACATPTMMLTDSQEFYRKWIQDILDCQDVTTGHVQHTAPLMGGGGGPGGWGCSMVIVPYAYYKQFGETAMLERCYEPMRRWIGYLHSHSENGLVVREEVGGWCLGDWCPLEAPIQIPAPYVNSCYFLKVLEMLTEIASILGHTEHLAEYAALREQISQAIRKAYFDSGTGKYCGNVQGADAYALWVGLAGEDTARQMAEKYEHLGHFDTGFLGTDILMEMLFQYGYADTALKLLESEDLGSYLYMKRHGATTLWENWDGGSSQDHPMFGACVRQLHASILGIGQASDSAGYRKLRICPQIPKNLPWAAGSMEIPTGKVSVRWEQNSGSIHFEITIPTGTEAIFEYGGKQLTLTDNPTEFTWEVT